MQKDSKHINRVDLLPSKSSCKRLFEVQIPTGRNINKIV